MQTEATDTKKTGDAWVQPLSSRSVKLHDQCRQFEAVMVGEMLKSMRKTVPESKGWFGESSGVKSMKDMFDQRLSDVLAQRGSLGVAAQVYRCMASKDASEAAAASPAAAAVALKKLA